MNFNQCYCCSQKPFKDCCEPFLTLLKKPISPEQLMRSRYSAYATQSIEYLILTTYPPERINYSKQAIKDWSASNNWLKLEVLHSNNLQVEFKAFYTDKNEPNNVIIHHERSNFVFENNNWFYVDGIFF